MTSLSADPNAGTLRQDNDRLRQELEALEAELEAIAQKLTNLENQAGRGIDLSPSVELPDAPTLLNQYKAMNPKTKVTLTEMKAILSLLPQNS
ncbi:MAG: hypothetical protein ACM37W_00340 [Actinomycetota bacterium]